MAKPGSQNIVQADSIQPSFGVPWIDLTQKEAELRAMSKEQLEAFNERWEEMARLREEDPTRYGWKLPSWDRVLDLYQTYGIHVVLGGQRSSKSSLIARIVVHLAETIPEAKIWCWHTSSKRSIDDQQTFIWDALPAKYKNGPKRGQNLNVQYTQQNGFVGDNLILPPQPGYKKGSTIFFGNYNQYKQDSQVTEGWWAHACWCDEEVPADMFNTLLARLTDRKGRMFLSFTTIKGWTSLIARILGKTKTLEKRYASLVSRDLPVLQESISQSNCVIHYFWTQDNPFVDNGAAMVANLKGRPTSEILARAYGIPTKSATTVFPKFNEDINVIPHEELPWLNPKTKDTFKCTRYMCVDGAGARNWFMLWVAVDPMGTWWVYRDWPDLKEYGEWAEPGSNPGGNRGPAQDSLGFGTKMYVDMIRKLEEGEDVFERYIDPRFAASPKQLAEGVITPQQELSDLGMDFIPAPGVHEDAGIQEINTLLEWDDKAERTTTNSPKIFISDRCQQFIFAMKEYTASQGKDEPTKDAIDTARYLAVAHIEHMDLTRRSSRKAKGY